jgi:hypothetical protein
MGFKICRYDITIDTVLAAKTRKEQQAKIEKISLVAFLSKEQRRIFYNICRRLKRNDKDFYQNKNLHVTLFGSGPLEKKDYERIQLPNKSTVFIQSGTAGRSHYDFEGRMAGSIYQNDNDYGITKRILSGNALTGQFITHEDKVLDTFNIIK